MEKLLLPSGLYDLLPPEAGEESHAVASLLGTFAGFGYDQVTPPLLEYEESLLSGRGEALSAQTFRVMDPLSQKMMGLRADMTLQVGRIATTRLASHSRPLRLSYAGSAVRMKGESLSAERETMQAGVELIGVASAAADAEVILLAVEALQALGIADITVDLNLPQLVHSILIEEGVSPAVTSAVEEALTRKDISLVTASGYQNTALLQSLLACSGSADTVISRLQQLPVYPRIKEQVTYLSEVVELLTTSAVAINITVDAVENRGFEYHKTLSFSLFSRTARAELGRGGRYEILHPTQTAITEEATGVTLYVGRLLLLMQPSPQRVRVYVAAGTSYAAQRELRAQGYATLQALQPEKNIRQQAQQLHCTYIFINGKLEAV